MKTKIIATIGPASEDEVTFKSLVGAGMDIVRLNTKYGSKEQFLHIVTLAEKYGCEVLYDIKGKHLTEWLKDQVFDYLAVSFAENPEQIEQVRKFIDKKSVKIISKIESQRGVDNIEGIIGASDGIMVARGDLSENVPAETVPIYQKLIIRKCNQRHKMVITATEMLLSMTDSNKPEKAEISDIANAVLDGSDAVMLSEETAIGKYPALAVKTMSKIIVETQKKAVLLNVK
ncbi:MAG TPA: pyruvate kinase [bacterium]|nr:pyruvate kinase [bacterium]